MVLRYTGIIVYPLITNTFYQYQNNHIHNMSLSGGFLVKVNWKKTGTKQIKRIPPITLAIIIYQQRSNKAQ